MYLCQKVYSVTRVVNIQKGTIFQDNRKVIESLDLNIDQDELVYLIGRTGAGKSSLLKTLYGELPFRGDCGEVAGFDLRHLNKKQVPMLRRKLGIIFQDFQLLTDRTVADNLRFVMGATGWKNKKMIEERVRTVIQMVDLENKLNRKPHELSGGEQQRIAIARALINKPRLILADEPTGNLDPQTAQEIMQLFIAVAKEEKSAILMATHNMTLVEKYTGRVVKMENNTLKEIKSLNRFNPFQPLEL